jgi:hypothetical protein
VNDAIILQYDDSTVTDCNSAIIVPERAIDEAGYIRTLTASANASSKHEFQAMAQTVSYQFQDGELDVAAVNGIITLQWKMEVEKLTSGMVIYRDFKGNFHVLAHAGQNYKKLMEAAYRFCTRWVRLDI